MNKHFLRHGLDRSGARRYAVTIGCVAALAGLATGVASASSGTGGISSDGTSGGSGSTDAASTADGVFPVRAKHTYGDGLGAGRNHQGQDILAKCGKRVVSALPGRVSHRAYQSAAGNYVVVDGEGKLPDTVYMHLSRRASVRKGQKVAAGTTLGRVGDTGHATACHLHFEMWAPPGWYKGGKLLDPSPSLHRWDRSS